MIEYFLCMKQQRKEEKLEGRKKKGKQVLFKSTDIGLDVGNITEACLTWQEFQVRGFARDKCVSHAI